MKTLTIALATLFLAAPAIAGEAAQPNGALIVLSQQPATYWVSYTPRKEEKQPEVKKPELKKSVVKKPVVKKPVVVKVLDEKKPEVKQLIKATSEKPAVKKVPSLIATPVGGACCADAKATIALDSCRPCYTEQGLRSFAALFSAAAERGVENATIRAMNQIEVKPAGSGKK